MASLRYIVVATLARAKLGAKLTRGSIEELSEHVESRRSFGIKKCCSTFGVLFAVLPRLGMGGGMPGDSGGDRPVTPGMYAI